MQGTHVRSLVRKLRSHMPRGNRACALEPVCHNYWTHVPWSPHTTTREKTARAATKIPRDATKTWRSQINKWIFFKKRKRRKKSTKAATVERESEREPNEICERWTGVKGEKRLEGDSLVWPQALGVWWGSVGGRASLGVWWDHFCLRHAGFGKCVKHPGRGVQQAFKFMALCCTAEINTTL